MSLFNNNVYTKTTQSAFKNAGVSIGMTRGLIEFTGEAVGRAEQGGRRPFLLRHGLSLEQVCWYRKMSINTALFLSVPVFGIGIPYAMTSPGFPFGVFMAQTATVVIGFLGGLAWLKEIDIVAARQGQLFPVRAEG